MPVWLTALTALLGLIIAIAAVVKIFLPVWRSVTGLGSDLRGGLSVLVGRDPFVDKATGKTVERVPPIGTALADIRGDISEMTKVIKKVADQDGRIGKLEKGHDEHATAIALLLATTFEKGADKLLKAEELKRADVIEED